MTSYLYGAVEGVFSGAELSDESARYHTSPISRSVKTLTIACLTNYSPTLELLEVL